MAKAIKKSSNGEWFYVQLVEEGEDDGNCNAD